MQQSNKLPATATEPRIARNRLMKVPPLGRKCKLPARINRSLRFLQHSLNNSALALSWQYEELLPITNEPVPFNLLKHLVHGLTADRCLLLTLNDLNEISAILDSFRSSVTPQEVYEVWDVPQNDKDLFYNALDISLAYIRKIIRLLEGDPSPHVVEDIRLSKLFADASSLVGVSTTDFRIPWDFVVRVDRLDVVLLLENLFSNSIRACERKNVPLDLAITARSNGSGKIFVSVADNGIGFSKEEKRKAFHSSFTSKAREKNLHGVGLIFCKSVVEWHGGEISLHSKRGVGTTVTFSLPAGEGHSGFYQD